MLSSVGSHCSGGRIGAAAIVALSLGLAAAAVLQNDEQLSSFGPPPQDEREEVERLVRLIPPPRHLLPIVETSALRPVAAGGVDKKNAAPLRQGDDDWSSVLPRAFENWNHSLPCDEQDEDYFGSRAPADTGFLFPKPHKCGSSTAAGVNLRIAWNVAKQLNKPFPICRERSNHVTASDSYGKRIPDKSYLWTIIRDPTTRFVSMFFHFKVSRGEKMEPNMENLRTTAHKVGNYYHKKLPVRRRGKRRKDKLQMTNEIIQDYDFIGVTERMHESFVAMSMLLNLPLSDFLYLNAKIHGGYDPTCTYITPSFLTADMREFLESDEWKELSQWDRSLHRAVNRSLDMTIDKLGRPEFDQRLHEYEEALKEAEERCRPNAIFPCSEDGQKVPGNQTDCLFLDSGCAFGCLDEVATARGLW